MTNKTYSIGKSGKTGRISTKQPVSGKVIANTEQTDGVNFAGEFFRIIKFKGKKMIILPWKQLEYVLEGDNAHEFATKTKGLRGKIVFNSHELLAGEKMDLIIKIATTFNLQKVEDTAWPRNKNFSIQENSEELIQNLQWLFRVTVAKQKSKELGFICLFTDGNGLYWFKCSRGFHTALNESIASLEILIDEAVDILTPESRELVNALYRKLNSFFS